MKRIIKSWKYFGEEDKYLAKFSTLEMAVLVSCIYVDVKQNCLT